MTTAQLKTIKAAANKGFAILLRRVSAPDLVSWHAGLAVLKN